MKIIYDLFHFSRKWMYVFKPLEPNFCNIANIAKAVKLWANREKMGCVLCVAFFSAVVAHCQVLKVCNFIVSIH